MKIIDLKNKNVFISGATGDIGMEISKKFSDLGCNLVLNGTNEKKLKDLSDSIKTDVNKIEIISADLGSISEAERVAKEAKQVFNIDIVVNSAGVFPNLSIANTTNEVLLETISVNLIAPFVFIREFSQVMMQNNWGRIINIGSSSSYSGFKNTSAYCASKHALLGLSRSAHDELKEHSIRTYCLSPSSTQGKMGKKSTDQDYSTFLSPSEIAEYVEFIISFDSNVMVEELMLKRLFTR
jgi:fengycin family lipopeptide synthetase B